MHTPLYDGVRVQADSASSGNEVVASGGADGVASLGDGPAVKCHYTTRHTCTTHPDCEWCVAGDTEATGACYTAKQAEYLPEKIWTCKKLADGEEEAEAAETAADDDAQAEASGPSCRLASA